jgi:predicted AlkP superfamily phosphohydrolase/phosphomutase
MARCIVVLTDGLRPDAITRLHAPALSALGGAYTRAQGATTIRPSVTVAALASLATGVAPATHGLTEPGLGFLGRLGSLRPLARELSRRRIPTVVAAGAPAPRSRPVAWALVSCAGAQRLIMARGDARDVVRTATPALAALHHGLGFVYLPDCDRAGHAHGWMSAAYHQAVATVDAAVGLLVRFLDDSLIIVVSDHGGGGVVPTDHDLPHPVNDAIPLILAGAGVRRHRLIASPVSLLDVPATVLRWFGVPIPEVYEGRPLDEAFELAVHEAVA